MRILMSILIAAVVFCPAAFSSGTEPLKVMEGDEDHLVVQSETLEIDNKNQRVVFTGNVDAKRGDFTIKCNKMHLYYLEDESSGKAEGPEGIGVDRIVATGDVRITSSDGAEATADEAVYHQKEDKVILTGNPVLKQGEDFVEGSRITFFMGEKRSIVESLGKERVRAVISPGGRKR